jgi:hypothetical protein
MDATTRARLEANLATFNLQRAALSAALTGAAPSAEVQTYSLSDPEGLLSATRRDPIKILAAIKDIDRQIETLEQRLRGGGIHFLNLRRRVR